MNAEPLWTDAWQTYLLAGQLALLVIAAVFAWLELRAARSLREDQTRPFVVVDLGQSRPKIFDVVIQNIGTTMATDVHVTFDPEFESSDKTNPHPFRAWKVFTDGISTMPPGKEIRTSVDAGPARFEAKLPDVYTVKVNYCDAHGKRRYAETMTIDFGLYWNRIYVTIHDVHDVHAQLKKLTDAVKGLRPQR